MKLLAAAAALAVTLTASSTFAGTVSLTGGGAGSTSNLGAFTGTMTYDDVSTLTITLRNTTPAGGGYITGFLFNVDGHAAATLSPSPAGSFLDLRASSAGNALDGNPFGAFEAGAALGGQFLGGGSPNGGIAVGDQRTFTFDVVGADASSLTVHDFLSQLSSGSDDHDAALLVRFRGINLGAGSDKVPGFSGGGENPVVPLPPAALAVLPVIGMLVGGKLRKRLRPAQRSA